MNAGLFVYYTLVLLLCLGQVPAQSNDPCVIGPGLSGQVQETPSRIVECFNAIELTSERKENTIEVLRQVISLYSFSDILTAKIPPWNQEVDLLRELNNIENKEYSRDYDFHADLQRLFTSLNDAHTLYIPPSPYSSCFAFKPFGLVPISESQKVLLGSNNIFVKMHIPISWGFDPKDYFGAEITAINDEPTYSYLKKYADRYIGQYRDLSVRFNVLFQPFGWGLINTVIVPLSDVPSENLTLLFLNGTTTKLEVPVRVSCENVFKGTEEVNKLIDKPASKRSIMNEQEEKHKYGQMDVHREMRESIERMIKSIPTQSEDDSVQYENNKKEEQLRDKQQTELFAKQEQMKRDTRNFKFMNVANNDDVGINIFVDSKNNVIPVLRLLSFMPTTEDEINDFAQTLTMYKNMMSYYRFNYTIVDVRGNGGGIICLPLFLSAMLSQDLAHTDQVDPTIWLPFNLKKSRIAEQYFMNDLTQREMFIDPNTGVLLTSQAFYSKSLNVTYGDDVKAQMTAKAYFPAFCKQFILDPNMGKLRFWPKNVIIVTDGTCGSACAQFVAKMSQNNRALVVAYGGLFENTEQLRSGSFPGGNVLELPGNIDLYYPDLPLAFKTSARARFNNVQSFARLNSILPLDFDYQAFTPTVNLKEYITIDISTNSIIDYSSAIELWPDFQQQVANVSEAAFRSFPTATDDPIIIDTSMLAKEGLAPWTIIAIITLCVIILGSVGVGLFFLVRFVRRRVTENRRQHVALVDYTAENNTEYHELVEEIDDLRVNN